MDELLFSRGAWRCLVTHPGPVHFGALIWETVICHTCPLWAWNSGPVSPASSCSRHQRVSFNTFHTSSQIYDIIYLDVVQEHLMKGQRRCPRGSVAAWPYMEKVSRNQRHGWPGCPELSVKGGALPGTGWSGLHLRIKPRRPFSEPGSRHVGTSAVRKGPDLLLPGLDLHPRFQPE